MRVYKIITDITEEESDNMDKIVSEEDGILIVKLDETEDIFSWDFVEGETFIPYMICTEEAIKTFTYVCTKYGYQFEPIDITEEFLMGQHEIPDSDFIRYREENLTEDMVFDKIKKYGGDSLSELDKTILLNNC
jgi:hypothetical protein